MKNRRILSFHKQSLFGGGGSRLMLQTFPFSAREQSLDLVHTEKGSQFPPVARMCTFMLVHKASFYFSEV